MIMMCVSENFSKTKRGVMMSLADFMDGVTVLSKTEIKAPTLTGKVIAIAIWIVLLIIVIFMTEDDTANAMLAAMGVTVFSILVALALSKSTGEYEYKVTVDDSVSMNDFYDHYKIKSQEGKIYTIELKDTE